jgi:phage FluMu protein Com
MSLLRWLRRLACAHRWFFCARLPEIAGRAAIQVRCEKCGAVDQFYDAKIIG